jgi:predicted phosphodiesterase
LTERIGVISDIHGNSPALRAVLEDLRQHGCDRLVVLGDIINGVDPEGCVALLREWGDIVCVRGNAEAYTLTPDLESLPDDEMFSSAELIQLVSWFRAQLTVESLQWLTDFPDFLIEDGTCYVHNSPIDRKEKQRWHRPNIDDKYQEWFYHSPGIQLGMPDEQWDELIEFLHRYNILYVFCGHTHVPFQRKTGDRLVVNAALVCLWMGY